MLALVVIGLTIFGVVMVYNTSVVVAFEQFNDKYWFLKNQLLWAILGVGAGAIVSNISYKMFQKYALHAFIVSFIMIVLVLIPGFSNEIYGARNRLVIPGIPLLQSISIQPSEIIKLTLVMYLAALLTPLLVKNKGNFPHKEFLILVGTTLLLVALEPDLGNAILIAVSAGVVYFASGAPLTYVLGIGGIGGLGAIIYALSSEYRRARILTFLNPTTNTESISYHIQQIFIALGSGGMLGVGLGNSRQKHQYIPEVTTDSIFAIVGEELGLIGALLVVGALVFIIWRGFRIAALAQDPFARLLALGITTNIAVQAIVNLGGMVGIMPLTGVPLPFVSYGGTSLTILLVSVGILLSISRTVNTKDA